MLVNENPYSEGSRLFVIADYELGGVYALANIRGGGEFGPDDTVIVDRAADGLVFKAKVPAKQ